MVTIASIIFLGTGGDPFVIGKQLRSSGGIILQANDNQFHIDPGPGALLMAKQAGVNVRATTAIFVSNADLYRCNDINAVIDAMTYRGFDKKGVLVATKTLIHGNEEEPAFLKPFYRDCLERFIVLEAGSKAGINEIDALGLKTKHSDKDALGFKFFTQGFTLSYTGDTSYFQGMAEQYKNSNILIVNVPYLATEKGEGLNVEDAINLIKEAAPRLAIITNFGARMVETDPLYVAREMQKQTNIQVIAARDGMAINPVSYAVDQGQKTLQTFKEKEGQKDIFVNKEGGE